MYGKKNGCVYTVERLPCKSIRSQASSAHSGT